MKRIREFFSKKYSIAVAAILGALGFSVASCEEIGGRLVEYGCPHADFAISGRVTVAENGEALKGIQVVVEKIREDYTRNDTLYTNENGMYNIAGDYDFLDSINLTFTDIDGLDNGGEFSSKTETVKFRSKDFKGGDDRWYQGKAEKELNVNLELKK